MMSSFAKVTLRSVHICLDLFVLGSTLVLRLRLDHVWSQRSHSRTLGNSKVSG